MFVWVNGCEAFREAAKKIIMMYLNLGIELIGLYKDFQSFQWWMGVKLCAKPYKILFGSTAALQPKSSELLKASKGEEARSRSRNRRKCN